MRWLILATALSVSCSIEKGGLEGAPEGVSVFRLSRPSNAENDPNDDFCFIIYREVAGHQLAVAMMEIPCEINMRFHKWGDVIKKEATR